MRAVALAVRFGLELCLLASLAVFAAELPLHPLLRLVAGLLLCGVAAAIWGTFLSPRRKYEIGAARRLLLEAVFFIAAGAILGRLGYPGLGIALITAAAADRIALALLA